jgi:ABC-type molybdate transport system substrate-binding protein
MKHLIPLTLLALALTPWHTASAQNGEVALIAPGGIREAMEQLIPGFERKTGYKVKPIFGTGLVTKRQVASGDDFDVAVVQPPYPAVIASGNALDSTATPLASWRRTSRRPTPSNGCCSRRSPSRIRQRP